MPPSSDFRLNRFASLLSVIPPWAVNGAYVIAIGYVIADVGYVGYLEKKRGSEDMIVARQTIEAGIFQVPRVPCACSLCSDLTGATYSPRSLLPR